MLTQIGTTTEGCKNCSRKGILYLIDETSAQSTIMDASISITAAAFSAFLKCPTKGHLVTIGESAPSAFFADVETHLLSRYKAAAKQRLPVNEEIGNILD